MPREDEVVAGPKKRLAPRIACATLVVIEAYFDGKRKPLPYARCVELVKPFGTQPNLTLHQIERAGFFLGDASKAKHRDRIVNPALGLEARVDGVMVRFWPDTEPAARKAITDLASPASRKASSRTPKPPAITKSRAPVPTTDEVLSIILTHFREGEFTVSELRQVGGLTSTVFDRLDTLMKAGKIVHIGGIGHKGDPKRFRLVGIEEPAPQSPLPLKSLSELQAELAALEREIAECDSKVRLWDEDDASLSTRVRELEQELELARAAQDEHHASKKPDSQSLLARQEGLRALVTNYALLQRKKE